MKTTIVVELNPTGRISRGNKELLVGEAETEHGTAYVKLYRAVPKQAAAPVAPAVRKGGKAGVTIQGQALDAKVGDAEPSTKMKQAAEALGVSVEKLLALKAAFGA